MNPTEHDDEEMRTRVVVPRTLKEKNKNHSKTFVNLQDVYPEVPPLGRSSTGQFRDLAMFKRTPEKELFSQEAKKLRFANQEPDIGEKSEGLKKYLNLIKLTKFR